MSVRLGEELLREGRVTTAQLDEALKYQVIFGGKLGTNLIEMGVVEEEEVAQALSKIFGVPAASVDEVMSIDPQALASLPREFVEKYGVCPLRREGRRLTLLMADPSDYKLLEELSFRTGLIIRPMVVTEVRLVLALEKYYGIGRDRRYIHVTKKIAAKRPETAGPAVAAMPAPVPSPQASPAETAAAAPPARETGLEITLEDLAGDEELPEIAPLEEALDRETLNLCLADARDRDDVLDNLAAYLAQEFPRIALFLVRGNIAHGWKASIDHQDLSGFRESQIPLEEASVLKTVVETSSFFLGPIPRTPFNSMFLQEIGGRVPETALLVPLLMMGRVVGIIYVDGKGEELSAKLYELQKLTLKAAMAFEILVLKNKIVSL